MWEYTGEEGWVAPFEINIWCEDDSNDAFKLKAEITLDEAQPAILDFNEELYLFPKGNTVPAVRLSFNHDFWQPDLPTITDADEAALFDEQFAQNSLYHYFRYLSIQDIYITVDVDGVKDLVLQNDAGVLDLLSRSSLLDLT